MYLDLTENKESVAFIELFDPAKPQIRISSRIKQVFKRPKDIVIN